MLGAYASLAAVARASCPGGADVLPSFEHVVMNEGSIPLQTDRLLDTWHHFALTLPRAAMALRVKVNPSAQARAGDWKVVLCPECPGTDGSCLGVPFGHYWSPRGALGSAANTGRSRWQTAPGYAARAEGQRALWNGAFNDQQLGDSGWMFDVGVHDPALLALARGGTWYVGVQHAKAAAASNPNTVTEFRIFANVGASACTGSAGPPAGVDALCFPPGGAVVPYSTLHANLGHRGLLPLPPAVAAIASPACRAAATRVWCAQTHYQCGVDGVAVKPCPLLCLQMQGGWGGAVSAAQPCAALGAEEMAAVNEAVCQLDPPTDSAGVAFPEPDSGSKTNFGSAGRCFGPDGTAPPNAPPHPCEPVHFACETPECYLTARPLACECVSDRDPGEGPECQLRKTV